MDDVAWVNPGDVSFKISPVHDLRGAMPGDWDLVRRFPLADAVKHRSIEQRYAQGLRWEDTDLFRQVYARRIEHGDNVRGETTMQGLAAQYYGRVDQLFASMEHDGFVLTVAGRPVPLPDWLLGRGGEVFIGNQGNHRLAIARVLGLDKIAGRIRCRHCST